MPDTLLVVASAAIVVVLVLASIIRATHSVTVYEYERGVRFRSGRFDGVVEPGRYWPLGPFTTILRVDTRPALTTVPNQEVLTSDGITVKVTAVIQYRIVDVRRALLDVAAYRDSLYLLAQLALRDAIASRPIDDVLTQRGPISAELLTRLQAEVQELGIEVSRAELKDVMLPGDLKRVFAQVLDAQKAGAAALERARGETAALRSLANAARLADASPSLLQLRALQQLETSTGNTLILGLPPGTTPLPVSPTTPRRRGGGPAACARRGDGPPGT